ncbi:IS630 family transposase [Chloroflexus sp.]|uniref:IS630 family transposase n=1 Tax=Chloroflexus sp. TaxID=1904827 RepID=UPI00404936E8
MEAPAELVSRGRAARPRVRGKKGAIVQAYGAPSPGVRVMCVDELGPPAVKTYPGEEWKAGTQRATVEPNDGRRGQVWGHAAFEPATGQATCVLSPRRDSAAHIQVLEQVIGAFPAERWLISEDNLSIHTSRQTQLALAAWPEVQVQFIPKYACWLNLIEPWWKQVRALALKGRRFETVDELAQALEGALAYWNAHRHPYRWKKRPQEQGVILGGFSVVHENRKT